ncbi:MAG: TerB family tellurite resistance protein [Halomonas sp.]|nr:TerB family tellurite resistance protein [Halomonas sp.]MDN6336894.1 TerB family tellurite resistance protein [Halomonas sp.]MDN6336992.1 TerB family tellurite resistance protein [Halomonas sp.]
MLDAVTQFFQRALVDPERSQDPALTLELACAALLCEIMRADFDSGDDERAALRQMLVSRLSVSNADVDALMAMAEEKVDESVDHYQFVRLINEHYDGVQRYELVKLMWQMAWADGEIDPQEEHRIRRLAGLLYVSHSDFIRAKLAAEPR